MKLRIAGAGFMGSTHRLAIKELEGVELTELDRDADAIDICLPTDLHAAMAIEALNKGMHVFCEKPMALTAVDCERMIAAAHANKRVLMIGHVLRFWPEYLALGEFVDNHRNAITSAVFNRRSAVPNWGRWLPDEARSGGAILDLLIHDIDQALHLFGKPEWVTARSFGPVDTMDAALEYSDRLRVHIRGGWYPEGTPFHMDFAVSAGSEELAVAPAQQSGAYTAELDYFVQCVRRNSKPERCLPEAAANAVRLALLLKESRALNGKRLACVL